MQALVKVRCRGVGVVILDGAFLPVPSVLSTDP